MVTVVADMYDDIRAISDKAEPEQEIISDSTEDVIREVKYELQNREETIYKYDDIADNNEPIQESVSETTEDVIHEVKYELQTMKKQFINMIIHMIPASQIKKLLAIQQKMLYMK